MNAIRHILTTTIVLVLFASVMDAREIKRDFPRFTYGIEGSIVQTFGDFSHFNFISDEGERIDIKGLAFKYLINGQFLLNAGVNISRHCNISINIGYAGIDKAEQIFPISLRGTWLFGENPLKSRWLTYLSCGTGIGPGTESPALLGKMGGGYRISLNRNCKLDFLVCYQFAFIHPPGYEMIEGIPVNNNNLRRNNSVVSGVGVGVGINF